MTTVTLSWAQTAALNPNTPICLGCGTELAPALTRCASLRCPSCRANNTPLDRALSTSIAKEHP
jgi:predicted amidophosphoribosyltransferase